MPSYSGVSLLKNPGATTAYQGKDPSVHMECFPNRRYCIDYDPVITLRSFLNDFIRIT